MASFLARSFWFHGRRYLVRAGHQPVRDAGRALTRCQVERLLGQLLREDAASVRRLYAELNHQPGIAHVGDDVALRWLTHQVAESSGALGRFAIVETEASWTVTPQTTSSSPEQQRVERAIAQLGTEDLRYQGRHYRVVLAEDARPSLDRAAYETLGEREATALLRQWAADGVGTSTQSAALRQLLALHDARPREYGLLVLRRLRVGAAPIESGPSYTPSQLRAARERAWIALEAVDEHERPVAGVRVEFVLAGGVTTLITDALGMARVQSTAAGDVTIRIADRDGASWRPVGGAPAVASSLQRPARSHVVQARECLTKIAARYGLKGWRALWEHPSNEALRARRGTPHVLAPGDVVAIPQLTVHEIVRATGAVHRIEVARPSALVRLRLQDLAGAPLARVSYDYRVGTDSRRAGSQPTDEDGWLAERVPLDVPRLEIDVRVPRLQLVYDLRRLLPARDHDTEVVREAGVAARLAGLGYAHERSGAPVAPEQVALFQALHMKREDARGELDATTLDALEGAYTV